MVSRTHIVIDTDVLAAQSTAMKRVGDALQATESAANGTVSGSAFGLLASSMIVPAVNALAAHASQMLAAARELASAMQSGVETARESFEQLEAQIASTARECEP